MNRNNTRSRAALVALAATAVAIMMSSPVMGLSVKYKTTGMFTDSAGGQHPWSVNDAHTLIWDGMPYVPVGGAFTPMCIAEANSEENYKADVAALETLKSGGITDIVIKGGGPITSFDHSAWQRIINYLDSNGFTYGVELADGPGGTLKGHLISPNRYRLEGPSDETTITRDWPNVDSAYFIVVDRGDNSVREEGGAVVRGGKVSMTLREPLGSSHILIVYPRKVYKSVVNGGAGDVWTGFGEYRDRVLAFLKVIKFGQGLRFFLEPFTSGMDLSGEAGNFIPDSAGFRLGFEAYLLRKYTHEGSINSAWGMNDHVDNAEIAARLMPLWASGRGMPLMQDRVTGRIYPVDIATTQYWRDLVDYRDISVQEFMNTISDALRKHVANVPVIFKGFSYHRLYANPFGMGGYDGLGVEAFGTGDAPVTEVGGGVYSLAEESGKSTWFIVASTQASSDEGSSAVYPDENSMNGALDSFREIGCKGFFIKDLRPLISDGRQLDWLRNFKDKTGRASLEDFKPLVVSFPTFPTTGAYVKRLMPNTWWLPTLRIGKTSDIGEGLCAYTIAGEAKSYIWSNTGPTTATLKAGPTGLPTLEFPVGAAVADKKKGLFSISLTGTPAVMRGIDFGLVFPYETAHAEIERLAAAIPEADKLGADVKRAKAGMENAKSVLSNGQPLIAFGMARTALDELLAFLGRDMWIEGEQAAVYSFDAVKPYPGASRALALELNTDEEAPLAPYSATYLFETKENASFEIWVAGSNPVDASPASYSVDNMNWFPVTASGSKVESYAPGLAWYKLGTTNMYPGKHTLKFRIDGRRQTDDRYFFAIDAIVLSPKGFTPNGIMRRK